MDQKLRLLGQLPIFAACNARSLELIGSIADEVDVKAGTVLMRAGDRGDAFYAISSGTLRVERDGGEITLGPGDYVGEIALLDKGPRTATVTAATDARLFVLTRHQFDQLIDRFPQVKADVLDAMAKRVRATGDSPA